MKGEKNEAWLNSSQYYKNPSIRNGSLKSVNEGTAYTLTKKQVRRNMEQYLTD